METVVEEKPLSLATSRIVTIEPFPHPSDRHRHKSCVRPKLVMQADAGGHYSRVQALSRIGVVLLSLVAAVDGNAAMTAQTPASAAKSGEHVSGPLSQQ